MARPVRMARGDRYMTRHIVHRNIDIAMQYHDFVNTPEVRQVEA
jgi:hypothetical protein